MNRHDFTNVFFEKTAKFFELNGLIPRLALIIQGFCWWMTIICVLISAISYSHNWNQCQSAVQQGAIAASFGAEVVAFYVFSRAVEKISKKAN